MWSRLVLKASAPPRVRVASPDHHEDQHGDHRDAQLHQATSSTPRRRATKRYISHPTQMPVIAANPARAATTNASAHPTVEASTANARVAAARKITPTAAAKRGGRGSSSSAGGESRGRMLRA